MNPIYLVIRYKDTKKTVRRLFADVFIALAFINSIPLSDYPQITELKMEID